MSNCCSQQPTCGCGNDGYGNSFFIILILFILLAIIFGAFVGW